METENIDGKIELHNFENFMKRLEEVFKQGINGNKEDS